VVVHQGDKRSHMGALVVVVDRLDDAKQILAGALELELENVAAVVVVVVEAAAEEWECGFHCGETLSFHQVGMASWTRTTGSLAVIWFSLLQ